MINLRSTPLHVAFGFVAMGAWAAFANRTHGPGAMVPAFLVQGSLSGLLTLGLKRWLEWGRARIAGLAGALVPPLISCLSIAAILSGAHALAGTPEIVATIALPWTVSTLYGFIYTWSLGGRR
jgi:LytS/YehU family sensor histidine kinase